MTITAAMRTQHALCHMKAPHRYMQLLKDDYAHNIHPQAQIQSKPAAAQDQVVFRQWCNLVSSVSLCQMYYIETRDNNTFGPKLRRGSHLMLRTALFSILLSQKCTVCQAPTLGVYLLHGLLQLHLHDLICSPCTASDSACQFSFIPSALITICEHLSARLYQAQTIVELN